jgi:diguanylate cyclase (GGDEF)-like protein
MAAILIVEPPSPERDALTGLLTAAGHAVSLAADGEDALQLWRVTRHQLVVADERAPRRAGLELAARLKLETAQGFTPVVLVGERKDPAALAQALATVEDVVARPYHPVELAARIEALLRTRRLVDALRAARAESEARSLDDPVTGLRNRMFLLERLHEEWKRSARYNEPLSLLLVAVEGLRELGEKRGAEQADRVLAFVAGAALSSLRQIDLVTRHGDAELAALLPNTHFAGSVVCAERLHRAVRKGNVDGVTPLVSMGVAFYPGKDLAEPNDLLRVAAQALQLAQKDGPGAICLYQHQGYLFRPA